MAEGRASSAPGDPQEAARPSFSFRFCILGTFEVLGFVLVLKQASLEVWKVVVLGAGMRPRGGRSFAWAVTS